MNREEIYWKLLQMQDSETSNKIVITSIFVAVDLAFIGIILSTTSIKDLNYYRVFSISIVFNSLLCLFLAIRKFRNVITWIYLFDDEMIKEYPTLGYELKTELLSNLRNVRKEDLDNGVFFNDAGIALLCISFIFYFL